MSDEVEKPSSIEVVAGSARPLDAQEEALLEIGKKLFIDSDDTLKGFASQMITTSSGAIPIYLALLGLANLKGRGGGILLTISLPAAAFVISVLIFSWALVPRSDLVRIEVLDEIREAHDKALRRRYLYIRAATFVFVIGTIGSIASILALMATS